MSIRMAIQTSQISTDAEAQFIAQVFRHDPMVGDIFMRDISIPFVNSKVHTHHDRIDALEDFPPGPYLLQVSLPNGDTITEKFVIRDNQDTELFINLALDDINQFYSHTIVPNHPETGLIAQSQEQSQSTSTSGLQLKQRFEQTDHYGYYLVAQDHNPIINHQCITNLANLIQQNLDGESLLKKFAAKQSIHLDAEIKGEALSLRFKQNEDFKTHNTNHKHDLTEDPKRRYLLQQSAQALYFICLPTPWLNPQGQTNIEVLVNADSISDLNYSIMVNDPMIDSALSFIKMGALHKAAKLIDIKHAKKMLYRTIPNPFAALMGGYILVLGLDKKGLEYDRSDWMCWVKDLDDGFPWLPDGAILHASMRLMLATSDWQPSYQILMSAYERGLPVFSFGLKLLIDAMRYFANQGDKKATERLIELETIAMCTDPEQPFLSIQLSSSTSYIND